MPARIEEDTMGLLELSALMEVAMSIEPSDLNGMIVEGRPDAPIALSDLHERALQQKLKSYGIEEEENLANGQTTC